jgi:hypothetical protein
MYKKLLIILAFKTHPGKNDEGATHASIIAHAA